VEQAIAPTSAEIRSELERLQGSAVFAGSVRLLAFLRFVVEETLGGGVRSLKEAVIGDAVYGREPPYDPQIDSTVRVEAARLRRKLKEYYAGEGHSDPVAISLPTGGYVPCFARQRADKVPRPREPTAVVETHGLGDCRGTTLTVAPLRCLTDDAGDLAFADALGAELTAAMARSPGLRAVSHWATLPGGPGTEAHSPDEAGVDAVLRGAVARGADVVSVTLELCDRRSLVVWSERFDAPAEDRPALHDRVCASVRHRLRFDGCGGADPVETLATVLRARQLLDEQTPVALRMALQLFSSVCRCAPDYARGHAGVADAYCDLYRLGLISRAMALGAAKPAALRALQLDSQSIEAHVALATISSWLERGRMAAERSFERALELGDDARAARLYGMHLATLGRHREAGEMLCAARALEPHSVHQEIAEAKSLYFARRYGAIVTSARNPDQRARSVDALFYQALALIFAGQQDIARARILELGRTPGRRPDLLFARAELEAWLGAPGHARSLLRDGGEEATHYALATLAAAAGDDDRCLDELDAAATRREFSTFWLRSDARFDRVRGSARFDRVLERLDGDQAELSYCSYLIDHDLCPRRTAGDCDSQRMLPGAEVGGLVDLRMPSTGATR
jgi:TolB-like protein